MGDHTVGSRPTKTTLAYIAGFLDGDGSIMLQVKRRRDTKRGWRFMATICFYQDARHAEPLHWMRSVFGIGYSSLRNDGIAELRVNGFAAVRRVLGLLQPYLRFKRAQTTATLHACALLEGRAIESLSIREKRLVCEAMHAVQTHNYRSHRKRTREEIYALVGLTP